MRRVGRGGSPEVVVGPCDYSSPCASAETCFRELDDVFLQTQTRIWLGEVLHVRFDEETSIADLLADGELLFQVSKVVWRRLLKKHAELKHSKVYIHERASFCKSGERYMAYPKVDSFLRICQILGLTAIDLFSSSDVVEKRDIRRVCMCVRSLSKKARTKDLNVPDFDIVTYTIAMPTYMVGSIRRRLEQSWWSSTNSSGCTPCMDLKEIYRQRNLDSDYMWHHSSCSESDDAEDAYREYELQSPASITPFDDADISSLIGENLPGSGSVAEENIYPPQNFFTLTWEQDEDVFRGVQSVETYLDSSLHFPHLNNTSNGNLQVATMCCSKSSPPCRTCQARLDGRTSFSFMEDMSWLQPKTNSGTEIHKHDFGQSLVNTSSSRNLASESDSCLTVNAKEEKYEASTSLQDDSIENFLPESDRNLDSVKEEFSEVTVVPPTSEKAWTCVTEDHETIDSTCVLLLDKVAKENGRHVLECNNRLSDSAGLLDSCENRYPEVHLMDSEGEVAWDNHNISGLNAGSYVNKNLMFGSPDPLPGNSDSILQTSNNHYSISIETVEDNQSSPHIEALNVNLGHLENKTKCNLSNSEVSLIASQSSGNMVTVICEDLLDTGGCLQFPDFQSPEKNSQIILIDELTVKRLPGSLDDEGSSVSMLNEASLNGNGVDPMSSKLCNLSVETIDLDRETAICHESQESVTDGDTHSSDLQNQALIDDNFLSVSHIDSVSEELGLSQVSVGCSESNSNYPPGNRHHSQFINVIQGASDSSTKCGKQSNGFLSCNGDAFSTMEEQTMDFCAQLHDQSLSSDSFSRVNDSSVEKDLIFEKLVDKDGKRNSSAFEDLNQTSVNNFCMYEDESQSRAHCLSRVGDSNEDTKIHQIAVVDGKSCSQSMENQMLNNLWMEGFRKQAAGSQPTVTERERKSLIIEPGKTCCPCCRTSDDPVEIKQYSFVEPCTGNSMNCCIKDKAQQGIDFTSIPEVPKEKCLTHNETVQGSLHVEESSVSILHHLDSNARESKGSEELFQGKIQKMDFNVSVSASLPVVDFSERRVSVGTWHNHLDQAEACTLKNGGLEITLASNGDCLNTGSLDTNAGSINPERHSQVYFSDAHTIAHCDNVSSAGYVEFRSLYVRGEESPCSTACVLDMENSADQSIALNNHHQPLMDEDENSMYHNDFACTETLKKDVEDGDLRTAVRPDERKREEAAGLESNPAKKILLKSFAGGMTIFGALFLFLHFRRTRERGNAVTNVVKLQAEKASHERRPDKDKHSRLYPAEKFKF